MQQIVLDKERLLIEASAKVNRLREIRETIALGEQASREVKQCLNHARRAISKLSRPEACFGEVDAEWIDGGVALKEGPEIFHERLNARMAERSNLYTYSLSLGYESSQMMAELNGDYSIYHFHYYIGRTLLQLMGRQFIQQVRELFPDCHWSRFPVLVQMEGDALLSPGRIKRHYWDPERIVQLLPLFKDTRTHFSVTEAGCISPLFSIIGIMLSTPIDQKEARGS
jgi:hypothetical protein|tara:strand:+ start:515 stop:1195 length:681 start_codon:yes stop_codon:yes gene_type:complete